MGAVLTAGTSFRASPQATLRGSLIPTYPCHFQEAERVFEQGVGRLRAELAGDKEAALSAMRRDSDEELQVTTLLRCCCCCWPYSRGRHPCPCSSLASGFVRLAPFPVNRCCVERRRR